MKPIKVKIKGLNSFEKEQEIDFNKLIEKGLFGIFGPTGSGKTTILDAITLSLYGEVARKSTNFMNTNCNSLNVSFEFQMSGKEIKRYKVDREFKRDNRTGKIKSKSAKIVDITENDTEVLEEGVRGVNEKCEEILGLSLDDFTRTVVLPQGKFSEFLKLEGKERRNMLERLFNLQEYGDELSFKLGRRIKKEREKENVLMGQLKGYENINEDVLKGKKHKLKEDKNLLLKASDEWGKAEEQYNESKELWKLQIEMQEKALIYKELKGREDEIKDKEKQILLCESALKVKPYIDNYENTLQQIEKLNSDIGKLKRNMELILVSKNDIAKKLELAKYNKDNKLPEILLKKQKVMDAIEEKKLVDGMLKEKERLEADIKKLSQSLQTKDNNIKQNIKDIENLKISIADGENKVEGLKFSEEYKRKVNEGLFLSRDYVDKVRQKTKVEADIERIYEAIKKAGNNSEDLSKKLQQNKIELEKCTERLNTLSEKFPDGSNLLLSFQEKLNISRDKWSKYREYNNSLKDIINNCEELRNKLSIRKAKKDELDNKINSMNKKVNEIERQNMARMLREKLQDGEPCPVCGSVHHVKSHIEYVKSDDLDGLKGKLNEYKKEYDGAAQDIVILETKIKAEEKNENEIKDKTLELGEEFKEVPLDVLENEFKNLKDETNKVNIEKSELDKKIKLLIKTSNKIEVEYQKEETVKTQGENQVLNLKNELKETDTKIKEVKISLDNLKEELKIENFSVKSNEILQKEKLKAQIENEIKGFREALNRKQIEKEKTLEVVTNLKEQFGKNKAELSEKDSSVKEKLETIKNKVGNEEDLCKLKDTIESSIKKIEEEYAYFEKEKSIIEEKYNKCNGSIIECHGNLSSLKDRKIKDIEKLNSSLREENFEDIDEAKKSYVYKNKINEMKLEIEKYKEEISKASGAIEILSKKIDGRNLTEEKWIEIQNNKNEKCSKVKALEEAKIKLEEEIKGMEIKLSELHELLSKQKELEHKLSLLDDLEKLFKGKKFVEFVALNQLKYISIEASKRLKEITGGIYGLEVDENGKFIIRDYKNGGAKRDASTLSGGETFVASLALALSLSNQIQLKGNAPLELFFLDEGFGTLDDNLLEVVMDSLERVHSDRLSIGIISHLESIKERMPVKLIVTPAEAGMGGSKVKIEVN